jgi:DNA replication ATP-dependent helicase Dna2
LPGSGKSYTIAFVTRLLVARGCRVLITSYTHSAVDNMLMKIMEAGLGCDEKGNATGDVIRIGKTKQCLPSVHGIIAADFALAYEQSAVSTKSKASTDKISSPSCNALRSVLAGAKVVGVSALTASKSSLLTGQHFDVVIVDEAGQICQPAVLGPLMAADRFVLVGDHMQLPPLTKSKAAESAGM